MAKEGFNYSPVSSQYFIEAMKLSYFHQARFFLFSDEIDWVKAEIITNIPANIDYCVVDCNGSDRGYMDLYLCSCCNHVIASQGSMGIMATRLGESNERIIVVPKVRIESVKTLFHDENHIHVVGV